MKHLAIMLLSITLLALLVACKPAKEAPAPAVIVQWRGTGTVITEPFTIKETPWLVGWEFTPATLNFFMIDIKRGDGSLYSKPVATSTHLNIGLADTFCSNDKGTFYLEITSDGGEWVVWVIGYK